MTKKKGGDDGGDVKKIGKKGGGGKLSRSETVTVRLDPKLRFAAELAARKHRRTLSSFIEWAVEESVKNVYLDGVKATAYSAIDLAWDVDTKKICVVISNEDALVAKTKGWNVWRMIDVLENFGVFKLLFE